LFKGYRVFGGRIAAPADDWFVQDPVRMLEIFAIADSEGFEIHPDTMRLIPRDTRLVDKVRKDPRANALFLDLLTSRKDPETVLRWLNEAGVFGRFISDFGRRNAQQESDLEYR